MEKRTPTVIPPPHSRAQLKKGIDKLTRLLATTLGPLQGMVLSTAELKPEPEPLHDAATIARRVTGLPDRGEEVGAMLLRHLVWRVRQRVGDGSATTAVLAQAIFEHASRYVIAGANPVLIQHGIKRAADAAIEKLHQIAKPVEHEDDLIAVAHAVTGHPDLSHILGEMFDLLGPYAHITIEDYVAPYLERTYVDGGRWQAKLASPYLINTQATRRAIVRDCHIALFDGVVSEASAVVPLLELVGQQNTKHLLLVAQEVTGDALNTLVAAYLKNKPTLQLAASTMIRVGEKKQGDLDDLALLTGARVLSPAMGDQLQSIQASDLGYAKRVEGGVDMLYVINGRGSSGAIRETITQFQAQINSLPFDDEQIPELQMRLARISGSSAILKIGAYNKTDRQITHQKAEQGIKALAATLEEGIVPGGGTAFLHCIPAVQELSFTEDEAAMGALAVEHALRAPFQQILKNAGIAAPNVYAQDIMAVPPGTVYDVVRRELCTAHTAGILDAAKILRVSLETAASGSMMALSTDTIILKRKPKITYEP